MAIVDVPAAAETITRAEFDRAIAQGVAQAGLDSPPRPGSSKYREIRETALQELLNAIWVRGQARELGISVTSRQIRAELVQVKKKNFKDATAYREFLETSLFSNQEALDRVELQLLSRQLQERIEAEAPPVTESDVEGFYATERNTKFTHDPTRDVRAIVNEDEGEVEAARKALEADRSVAGWREATKRYSPTTRHEAGLQKEISAEALTEPLKKDIFEAAPGELIGPIRKGRNYLVIEVVKANPGGTVPLNQARSQIRMELAENGKQKRFESFVTSFQGRWRARTVCAPSYAIESCSNGPSPSKSSHAPANQLGVTPGS